MPSLSQLRIVFPANEHLYSLGDVVEEERPKTDDLPVQQTPIHYQEQLAQEMRHSTEYPQSTTQRAHPVPMLSAADVESDVTEDVPEASTIPQSPVASLVAVAELIPIEAALDDSDGPNQDNFQRKGVQSLPFASSVTAPKGRRPEEGGDQEVDSINIDNVSADLDFITVDSSNVYHLNERVRNAGAGPTVLSIADQVPTSTIADRHPMQPTKISTAVKPKQPSSRDEPVSPWTQDVQPAMSMSTRNADSTGHVAMDDLPQILKADAELVPLKDDHKARQPLTVQFQRGDQNRLPETAKPLPHADIPINQLHQESISAVAELIPVEESEVDTDQPIGSEQMPQQAGRGHQPQEEKPQPIIVENIRSEHVPTVKPGKPIEQSTSEPRLDLPDQFQKQPVDMAATAELEIDTAILDVVPLEQQVSDASRYRNV